MKTTITLALALLGIGALPRAARAEQKIAYVDLQRALEETEEGKKAKTKLKTDFEKKQHELDARQEELKKMKQDLDKQAAAPVARTIYGVVKDSGGLPVTGATITVALAGLSRAMAKTDPASLKVTTDEDGFFKIEGVPPDVDAKVVAAKDSYQSRTLTTTPAEAGKKMVVFLPKVEALREGLKGAGNNAPIASPAPAPDDEAGPPG